MGQQLPNGDSGQAHRRQVSNGVEAVAISGDVDSLLVLAMTGLAQTIVVSNVADTGMSIRTNAQQ